MVNGREPEGNLLQVGFPREQTLRWRLARTRLIRKSPGISNCGRQEKAIDLGLGRGESQPMVQSEWDTLANTMGRSNDSMNFRSVLGWSKRARTLYSCESISHWL